jgi:DNA-binding PadR family transcriptional regulator
MYSEILILAMLRQGPRHGYEIKKDIDRALGGMVALNNKTLYLALKHFEEMGAVTRQVIPFTPRFFIKPPPEPHERWSWCSSF